MLVEGLNIYNNDNVNFEGYSMYHIIDNDIYGLSMYHGGNDAEVSHDGHNNVEWLRTLITMIITLMG